MMKLKLIFLLTTIVLLTGITLGGISLLSLRTAQAFPEYAAQTNETCGTCHFNPAGGGPRTPRGELWVIEDRPDSVPELPGAEVETADTAQAQPEVVDENLSEELLAGAQIYESFTCINCHGVLGEGSAEAPALNQEELSADLIESVVRTGPEAMPAIPETILDAEQMELLVAYVQNLATGRVVRIETLNAAGPIFQATVEPVGENQQ